MKESNAEESASKTAASPRVVILGAGVNGCALARELILNGVSTWVVDTTDIAAGATSKSSRLIHGGLRYLEYGEFRLVRESLAERERLRRLAPHFVTPLRLFIPVRRRLSGLTASTLRFLGFTRLRFVQKLTRRFRRARGMWLVRIGLWLYDRFAISAEFPRHTTVPIDAPGAPRLDPTRFRWMCSYSDAQMWAAERFCVALLEDAREAAAARKVEFRVVTHGDVFWIDSVLRVAAESPASTRAAIRPDVLVNATGAWGDRTLAGLNIPSPPLFGGTKGSHFLTWNERLVTALNGNGVYAEASDGRLVFILPHQDAVLVGTTDERFDEPPENAVATSAEIDYLLGMVNKLIPQAALTRADVAAHYSGVRPLPRAEGTTASISRDHAVVPATVDGMTVLTLVGGKLTTCRAFGELVADDVLKRLGRTRSADTLNRVVPGSEAFPNTPEGERSMIAILAGRHRLSRDQAAEVWRLFGTRSGRVLEACGFTAERDAPAPELADIAIPTAVVRWIIRNEWVGTLDDLVERRLMLVFRRRLTEQTLRDLAACLVAEGRIGPRDVIDTIAATMRRLARQYGRDLATRPGS